MQNPVAKTIKSSQFHPKADIVMLKMEPASHHLSKEEQQYFRKLTEGIFGYSEQIRNERLKSLATDFHITLIAPDLCTFLKETVHYNLVFTDLTLLIYAVRAIKSLLSNAHVDLKPHIHLVLPTVLSCCLAKKISKYYDDNHWTLRDFSAAVAASICHSYSDELNNMKGRVIEIYLSAIRDNSKGLATTYGAIKGLSSFGEDSVKAHLLPNAMLISNKIHQSLEASNYGFYMDHQKQNVHEAKHVRNVMVTICAPILHKCRKINDGGLSYVREFGYLGKSLYIQVKNIESLEQAKSHQNQYVISSVARGGAQQWFQLG
ncbi:hypothetical protein HUJ05_005737 [Dendroctonus ponderosae]|nr:hypothetical protein HUJ05_005737 [Dendroctonus ponderosae]